MTDFTKFPKIGQFSDVVRHIKSTTDFRGLDEEGKPIYEHNEPYPTLKFNGEVKLHGSNIGVRLDENHIPSPQSRTRDISLVSDNAGAAAFIAGVSSEVWEQFPKNSVVFGEWCGKGIQKNVAIAELPRMIVVFGAKVNDEWIMPSVENIQLLNDNQIFLITQFPSYEIEINFNKPELAVEAMIKLTEEVEKECPVGKYFGVTGIGEGIVWSHEMRRDMIFKVKGEKHQSSKVKKLASVDVEKVASIREFVETTCTINRMEQGVQSLVEKGVAIERKSTGDFLRWLVNDIMDEEAEMLGKSGLCAKDVNGEISKTARPFWFAECDKL